MTRNPDKTFCTWTTHRCSDKLKVPVRVEVSIKRVLRKYTTRVSVRLLIHMEQVDSVRGCVKTSLRIGLLKEPLKTSDYLAVATSLEAVRSTMKHGVTEKNGA